MLFLRTLQNSYKCHQSCTLGLSLHIGVGQFKPPNDSLDSTSSDIKHDPTISVPQTLETPALR